MELNQLKKLSINNYRLSDKYYGLDEKMALSFLLKDTMRNGSSNFQEIKDLILCMDKSHQNYNILTLEEKKLVDSLDEKTVDIVLATLFQWFGTHVGRFCLQTITLDLNQKGSVSLELKRNK